MSMTPAVPDMFDQVAAQPQTATGQPFQQLQPQQPQPTSQGHEDIFDQVATGAVSPAGQTTPATTGPSVPDSLHISDNAGIMPDDGALSRVGKGALDFAKRTNAVGAGIGDGVLSTLNGGANLLHLPHATLQAKQAELEQDNRENPGLNLTGEGLDAVGEFLAGDAILTKGLSYAGKLSAVAKLMTTLETSPRLMQAVQIGTQALKAGVVQFGQSDLKTGGDTSEAFKEAAFTGGASGLIGAALPLAKEGAKAVAAKYANTFDVAAIQKPFQAAIRSTLTKVAADAGVTPAPSASLRDVVKATGQAVLDKASGLYGQLDQATGGQGPFQRFANALKDTEDQLRQMTGIPSEEDAEKALLQRKAELQVAQQASQQKAIANGVDPQTIHTANSSWRQGQALMDLDKQLKQTITGLRPDMATAAGASSPEEINPNAASLRLHRLFNTGRLQVGLQDHAAELMQHADAASVRKAAILGNQKTAATVAKTVGVGGAALYGLDKGVGAVNR